MSPAHSVAGAEAGHTTSQVDAPPHASLHAPEHVALQVLTSEQLAELPGPSERSQLLTLPHDTLDEAPAVIAHALTSLHEASHPSPQLCSQVETFEQLVSQASPHDRSQVLEESHEVSHPVAGQSTVHPLPPEHPHALPAHAQPEPTHAGAGALLPQPAAAAPSTRHTA